MYPSVEQSEESDIFCQREEERKSATGELVQGRQGGREEERTGKYCVSSSPFYSFTLVPFWSPGAW